MNPLSLQTLPLLFSFKQLVAGNGFLAGVRMDGRALLEIESVDGHEEAWITGIAPVGITGGGRDRGVAFSDFRKAWTEVVFDISAKAGDFQQFKDRCRAFLGAHQSDIDKLWQDAVAAVRQQQYVDPSLSKGNADQKVTFEVTDLSHLKAGLKADLNEVENGVKVAA